VTSNRNTPQKKTPITGDQSTKTMFSHPTSNNDEAIQSNEERSVDGHTTGISSEQPDRGLGAVVAHQGRRLVPVNNRRGHNLGTNAVDQRSGMEVMQEEQSIRQGGQQRLIALEDKQRQRAAVNGCWVLRHGAVAMNNQEGG